MKKLVSDAYKTMTRATPEISISGQQASHYRKLFQRRVKIWDPDLVRSISQKADDYPLAPVLKSMMHLLFGDSILSQEGTKWKKSRSILAWSLMNREKFDNRFLPLIALNTDTAIQCVRNQIQGTGDLSDIPIDLSKLALDFTVAVIKDAIFSPRSPISSKVSADDLLEASLGAQRAGLKGVGGLKHILGLKIQEYGPIRSTPLPKLTSHNTMTKGAGALFRCITEAKTVDYNENDILTDLMLFKDEDGIPLSVEAIYDHITALIGAGFFTNTTTITMTLTEIFSNQAILDKAVSAARTAPDGQTSDYIENCIKEALRLHPPVVNLLRHAKESFLIGNTFTVKPTDMLELSIERVHKDAFFGSNPDLYDPDRFISLNAKDLRRCFMPFGHGPRSCIGEKIALAETGALVTALLKHFNWECAADRPTTIQSIAFRTTNRPLLAKAEIVG